MAVLLTGSGALFTRLGHLIGGLSDVEAIRGGAATSRVLSGANMATRIISTVDVDYANGTALPQIIDGTQSVLTTFQGAVGTLLTDFRTRATNTLLAMVAIDTLGASATGPLSQLVSGITVKQALQTLIGQMNTAVASVQAATVSAGAQTAVGSPTGNPVVVVSVKQGQGLTQQFVFPETLHIVCSGDAQSGTATAGNEPFVIIGQAAVQDPLSHLYPGGSGVSVTLSAVDGSKNNSTGNLLQNSDFSSATTANTVDNWVIGLGASGTDIFQTTSGAYTTGGGAVEFFGTGSNLLDGITQSFGITPSTALASGGTSAKLAPDTVYHVSGYLKMSGASPATGVLEVALTDGSAYPGTVLDDDQSTSNLFTVDLTAIADTNWHNFTGVFRTPAVLPTTSPVAKIRVRLSTHVESGKGVYVGRLSMAQAGLLYPGGPYVTIHSGNTNAIAGLNPDTWTLAMSNNYQTSTHGLLHAWCDRLFGMRQLGLMFPVNASPTVADTVIA